MSASAAPSFDIVVLGAGVLGLSVAFEASRRGLSVGLVDPRGPNASSVAAGMIAPGVESVLDEASPERAALLRDAAALWPAFARAAGVDYRPGPTVWRGPDAARTAARLKALGFAVAWDGHDLLIPGDGQVDAPAALAALTAASHAHLFRGEARRVERRPHGGWAIETHAGGVEGRSLVLATGAAPPIAGLPPAVAVQVARVIPIKGQIGWVEQRSGTGVVRAADVYVAPSGRGALVGATMAVGDRDLAVDHQAAETLLSAAERATGAALGEAVWRVGVRGATPDGLPLAGRVEPGLYLALAPRRNGWLLGPQVGAVILDAVEGRTPGAAARAFDPLRRL